MAVLRRRILLKLLVIFLGFICFTPVKADQFENTNGLNSFGMPGEIDLPSAINLPDGLILKYKSSSRPIKSTGTPDNII